MKIKHLAPFAKRDVAIDARIDAEIKKNPPFASVDGPVVDMLIVAAASRLRFFQASQRAMVSS